MKNYTLCDKTTHAIHLNARQLETVTLQNNFHLRTSCPDDPAEGSELQSMIASPTLQLPQPNGLVSTWQPAAASDSPNRAWKQNKRNTKKSLKTNKLSTLMRWSSWIGCGRWKRVLFKELDSCRQASTDVDIGVKVSDSLRQSVAGKLDADADGGGRSKACLNNREKKRRKSRLLLKLPRRSWIVTRVSFFTYTHFYDFMNARVAT